MRRSSPVRDLPLLISLLAAALALSPTTGLAACNQPTEIPAESLFNQAALVSGEMGSIDSPFLVPGKKIDNTIVRRRTIQHQAIAQGDVVSIAFFPVDGSKEPKLLVFADKCSDTNYADCNSDTTTDTECVKSTITIDLATNSLTFDLPDRFEFNSSLLAGPVRVAATPAKSIPCELNDASKTCAGLSGLHACIQNLKPPATTPDREKILSVTALPPSNDFSKICKDVDGKNSCASDKEGISLAVDAQGDLLIPMDWGKVIRRKDNPGLPCPPNGNGCQKRNVDATTSLPAVANALGAIPIAESESSSHLQTFSEEGENFQPTPVFKSAIPDGTPVGRELTVCGSIDKPYSVLRIRRCPTSAANCTAPKFDLANRAVNGGPIVISNPQKKLGEGTCDLPAGKACDKDVQCQAGSACVRAFGGIGYATPCGPGVPDGAEAAPSPASDSGESAADPVVAAEPEPVASPPPPPDRGTLADNPLPYWIAVLAILGVAWIFVRRRGI